MPEILSIIMRREPDYNKPEDSDKNLVKGFLKGDRSDFDRLVLRYKDKVFNLCVRYLGNLQEAEDISQDIFVKVYGSLRNFRFKSSFSTWLYRIAVNTCKNRVKSTDFRRMKDRVYIAEDTEKAPEDSLAIKPDSGPADPLTELERKERSNTIMMAVDSLPLKQKTLIILRDIEGLSYEDIIEITGIKAGTLKSRISRARLELRKKLEGNV